MNIIPLIGGIGFGCFGLFIIFDYYRFNRKAIKTQGTILRYDESTTTNNDGHKRKTFTPIFEYSDNGNCYEVRSTTSFSSKIIPVGHSADVLYQPGQEDKARLAKGNGMGLGILFVALSLPAFYFGLFGG